MRESSHGQIGRARADGVDDEHRTAGMCESLGNSESVAVKSDDHVGNGLGADLDESAEWHVIHLEGRHRRYLDVGDADGVVQPGGLRIVVVVAVGGERAVQETQDICSAACKPARADVGALRRPVGQQREHTESHERGSASATSSSVAATRSASGCRTSPQALATARR